MKEITSGDNPSIKELVRLRDKRARDQSNTFIIEGFREISRAITGKVDLQELFICPELFLGENEEALIAKAKDNGTTVTSCIKRVFEKISYRDRPDGLIAAATMMHLQLSSLIAPPQPLYIIAEGIEKPGNLGTILRTADAAGASGVIVVDRCTDIYNPNVVRASVGTLFTLPVVETTTDEALKWLQQHHIHILAATPHAEKLYTDVDMTAPVAICMGREQIGLSDRWMTQADIQVKIPMKGVADSLNVAM